MKNFFHFCIIFMISIFVNSICSGMEDIYNEFRCDHLNNCEQSYTITDYVNEKPNHESILCSQCAKVELMKRLKNWANLDQIPYFYCGLLRPALGIKIKYCEPQRDIPGYYCVTPSHTYYIPSRGAAEKEVFQEGCEDQITNFFDIDLGNDSYKDNYKTAEVYVCDHLFCARYGDMIRVVKGTHVAKNINYAGGPTYREVRECEKNGHVKLGYTIKIN